jgi:hypothetical protein
VDHELPGVLPAGLHGGRHRHRAVADREVLDPERGGVVLEGDATLHQRDPGRDGGQSETGRLHAPSSYDWTSPSSYD